MANVNFTGAKNAKNNEFYTQYIEYFRPENMMKYNIKSATYSAAGELYVLTFDKKVIISKNWLDSFRDKYSTLRQ